MNRRIPHRQASRRPLARALLGILAGCLLLSAAASGLLGCGPSKAQIAAQQKQECFDNQSRIKMAVDLVYADTGIYPSVTDAASKLGAKCPAGGTYTFDPGTDTVSCTVHGHP